jgi:hypothetical protein
VTIGSPYGVNIASWCKRWAEYRLGHYISCGCFEVWGKGRMDVCDDVCDDVQDRRNGTLHNALPAPQIRLQEVARIVQIAHIGPFLVLVLDKSKRLVG